MCHSTLNLKNKVLDGSQELKILDEVEFEKALVFWMQANLLDLLHRELQSSAILLCSRFNPIFQDGVFVKNLDMKKSQKEYQALQKKCKK